MENIFKCWGERRRIHLDDKNEIDLLYLKRNSFCSTHSHKNKINKFIVISGKVSIQTEYGEIILNTNDSWIVKPSMKHRFYALESSIMIEIGYVEKGKIDPDDIDRKSQGGQEINGKEMTLDELKEKGFLDL